MRQTLLLQVPKQHDFRNPAVELNPKRVDAWLKELPLLNLSQTAKALLDALAPANLQPMPAKTRVRLLELYRRTFVEIFDGLDEQALRSQPITPSQRATARDCGAALCRELANGYKLLIRELHSHAPQREPLLHVSLFRAMEATVLTLLDSYRNHQVAPTFAYLELHQLHMLSEQLGLLQQPVQLDKEVLSETGIGPLYRRVLMLSVADPYRLPDGTASKLYQLLAPLAPAVEIHPYQEDGPAGCYVVDRGSDGPPVPCAHAHSEYGYESAVLLDLRPALQRASEALQGDEESMRLLTLIAPQLQQSRQRRAPRRETRRETWIAFGVESIHYYVSRGSGFIADAIAESQADIQVRDLESDAEPSYILEPWHIVNESVSGYLLASQGRRHGDARVGDAVAVITATKDPRGPRLAVALVRWMRAGRDHTIEMGIELVPGNPRAVHCEHEGTSVPALLFPSVPALRLPANVVVPTGTLLTGARIAIRTGNRSATVRVGSAMNETTCLQQFDFENVDAP